MHTATANRYAGTNFVTGMRAFAALGVLFIHTGGLWFREWGEIGNNLADLGKTGVYVFFVISGFSVSQSYETSGSYLQYFAKRLRRIAPLYFFWLALCTLVLGFSTVGLYSVFMHVSFLSFLDFRVASSIIGVEWTIPIEMVSYLLIPLALVHCRGWIRMSLLLTGSFVISRVIYDVVLRSEVPNGILALHYSPIPYLFCFVLGIAAYRIRAKWPTSPRIASAALMGCALVMLVYTLRPSLISRGWFDELAIVSLLSFTLIAAGSDESPLFRALLCNPVAQYLGLISYGIYLSHLPIFLWLIAPATGNASMAFVLKLTISVAVSSVTYFAIEQPTKRRSRWVSPA